MAFTDDIDALTLQTITYLQDYRSRVARGLYSTAAADQALVKAAFTDLQAICASLNSNPVAVPSTVAGTVTIVQASAAITAAGGGSHTKQLYANVVDSSGVSRVRPVSWLSATPAKATIDAKTGLLTGVAAGTSNITATCEGVTSAAIVCTVS